MKSKINSTKVLTKRQEQVLPFILSSPSYEEAARKAKISPKQIYQWLKEDEFKNELIRKRNEIFRESLAFLKNSVLRASQTLICLLDSTDDRLKMQAADKILNNAFKGAELFDLEERLDCLEKRIKDKADYQS
jgi:hypothetical protein